MAVESADILAKWAPTENHL
ncbi:uncharacterized protein G2W53_037898 [Senna tora]|uniref:Uncharacterized protein n=1 Tax=Senna tora TaxID=362788 RepID=A0A834SL73_9FABA|nr:uncharacterized protein G2W53_037898 [Senna tora]